MRKQLKTIALSLSLLLVGCSNRVDTNVISISILNSKPEIQNRLEDAAKEFSKVHPDIKVKIVGYSSLQGVPEKMSSMINQGTTPTLMIVDPLYIQNIKDDLVALDQEDWVKDMQVTTGAASLNSQGQLIAFPFAVEGMGFIYNEQVMQEAGIDISKLSTRDDLAAAFAKVEALNKKALVISNEDWSLANHFLTTAFTLHSENNAETMQYVEDLRAGKVDLHADKKINGLLDTFDLMKEYNYYKENPLTPTAEKCAELLATGEVGFWYMGNWAFENLNKYAEDTTQFGFIPVPISNEKTDYGYDSIMGVIKYLVIDKKHNSIVQQEAAKEFLNWLAYDEVANNFIINQEGIIPGILTNDVTYTNSLSQSIQNYLEQGKVIEQIMAYIPEHNIGIVGNLMRLYLDNSIDRKTLLDGIAAEWQKQY